MGKGFRLEKRDNAADRMATLVDRSKTAKQKNLPMIERIKQENPDNWRQIVAEMIWERDVPGYLEGKQAIAISAKDAYYKLPRHLRLVSEGKYVIDAITAWRLEYAKANNMPNIQF